MDPIVSASIGANIENNFYEWATYPSGEKIPLEFTVPGDQPDTTITHTCKLEVLKVMNFESEDKLTDKSGNIVNIDGPKAIILKDDAGNVYVHFNGTGDGKWGYNSATYGDPPSPVQTDSLDFFNDFIENNYQGGDVFVSGHSQGGNTAQYVTVNSKYADYIDMCVSLDGPAMSNDAICTAKNQYGEAYFERQCNKIYGFYGEHDYVSPLGQQHVIPEDQIFYVENTGGDYHRIDGMMNGTSLNPLQEEGSPFRDLVVALNEKIKILPPEDQEQAAQLAMKFAEYFLGHGEENLTPTLTETDLEAFKNLLFPLLVEFVEENPEMIYPALISIGMDEETAKLIEQFVLELNKLPERQRLQILESLGENITVTENGKLEITPEIAAIFTDIALLLPTILETAIKNPELLWETLKQFGIDKMILNLLVDHPLISVGIVIAIGILFKPLIKLLGGVVVLTYLIEGIYSLFELLENLSEEIRSFLKNTFNAILETLKNFKEYLHSLTPGSKYANSNPYFRADPALLRDYARRLAAVNARLTSLDRDLDQLYYQVGLLDVLDILQANILTSYSARIRLAQAYLNSTADTLENADNQALRYMGG